MSSFDDALTERFQAASSGGSYDVQVNGRGETQYIPSDYVDIAAEDQLNPFAIQGEVDNLSVPEYLEKVGSVFSGFFSGAAAGAAGTAGDVVGIGKGAFDAISAEEGQRFEAFLQGLSDVSSVVGSEKTMELLRDGIDQLPLSDEVKADMLTASEYGELSGMPVGGAGIAKGAKETAGVVSDVVDIPGGPTSRQIPTQPKVDVEATPVDTKLIFETLPQRTNTADLTPEQSKALETDIKTSQLDIGSSAKEFIQAAKANQKPLIRRGKNIRKQVDNSRWDNEVQFKDPGVKGALDKGKRLAEKSAQKGGIHQITDINRAGFSVETTDQADAVVDALAAEYKIIDEGYTVTPLGYFDRKIMLINPDGQVGEIQVWPGAMYNAKIEDGGQELYSLWRGKRLEEMNATEKKEVAKIAKKYGIEYDTTEELRGAAKEKSIELYGNALKDLDPSMRGIVQDELFRIADQGGEDSALAIKMLDIMSTGKASTEVNLQQKPVKKKSNVAETSSEDSSDIFGAGSKRVTYTDENSKGTIEILQRPDGSASVIELYVPEDARGKGAGERLQKYAMEQNPVLQGQVSSRAAAKTAYRLGRRPPGQPDATLEDVYKIMDEYSSVNMVTPEFMEFRASNSK